MPPRGRGGKFSKPSRGGGKHFSRDLQPLDKEGNPLGMWRDPADKQESSDEESSEESSEEESEEDAGPSKAGEESLTREQRKELAKKRKAAAIARKQKKVPAAGDMPTDSEEDSDDDEDLPANPNHTSKAREMARAAVGPTGEDAPPSKKKGDENLSRREKEAIAAQQAKERYQKLHAEGKTDEAKADLARLKLIREQRDQAAARKQAEKEEREERERQNKEKLDKEDKKRADALGSGEKKKVAATKAKK